MNPHEAGRAAADACQPFTANPYTKPDRPPSGDAYPGEWAAWASGWCLQHAWRGNVVVEALEELSAMEKAARK